jgi:hypothetical protein
MSWLTALENLDKDGDICRSKTAVTVSRHPVWNSYLKSATASTINRHRPTTAPFGTMVSPEVVYEK